MPAITKIIIFVLMCFGGKQSHCASFLPHLYETKQQLSKQQLNINNKEEEQKIIENNINELESENATLAQQIVTNQSKLEENEALLTQTTLELGKIKHEYSNYINLLVNEVKIVNLLRKLSPLQLELAKAPHQTQHQAPQANLIHGLILLKSLTAKAKKYLQEIQSAISNIKALQAQQAEMYASSSTLQKELEASQNQLNQNLEIHKKKLQQMEKSNERLRKQVQNLTQQAKNLDELIKKIIKIENPNSTLGPTHKSSLELRQPVSGKIITRFGQKMPNNEICKGVIYETTSNAQVIAPARGKVIFCGTFKEFKNLIIISHYSEGLSSDLSSCMCSIFGGIEHPQVEPGQEILAGSPIGIMGKQIEKKPPPRLYYELRKGSQPIDLFAS